MTVTVGLSDATEVVTFLGKNAVLACITHEVETREASSATNMLLRRYFVVKGKASEYLMKALLSI